MIMVNSKLEAFLDKVRDDQLLQDRLIKAESNEEVIQIARELGFSLDESNLRSPSDDLNDSDLEAASGGAISKTTCTVLCILKMSGVNFEKTHAFRYCGAPQQPK